MTGIDQMVDRVRSDITGPAGNKNCFAGDLR